MATDDVKKLASEVCRRLGVDSITFQLGSVYVTGRGASPLTVSYHRAIGSHIKIPERCSLWAGEPVGDEDLAVAFLAKLLPDLNG